MRNQIRYLKSGVLITVLTVLVGTLLLHGAKAAGGGFRAENVSVASGASVAIPIYINTGGNPVDAVDMVVTYDVSKLEFQSASASGSPFDQSPIYNNSAGTISGGAYKTTSVNGDVLVFTVTFKAKVSSGSTLVQVASGSVAYSGGNSIGVALGSGTVSFTTPKCAAGQTGTYPNCVTPTTGGSTGSTGGTTGTTPAPKPATKPTTTNETPTPKKDEPKPSESSGAVKMPAVVSKYVVGVYDKNQNPLKRKKVTLYSEPQTVETDDKGIATFTDVAVGDHTIRYSQGGKEYSQPVTVLADTDSSNVGSVTNATGVVFPFEQTSNRLIQVVIGLCSVLIIIAAGFFVQKRWQLNKALQPIPTAAQYLPAVQEKHEDDIVTRLTAISNHNVPQPGQTYTPKPPNVHEDRS